MKALRPNVLALLAFCASLTTTAWVWQHERQNAHQKLQAQFEFSLHNICGRIAQRVNVYEQMLRGVQGFYSSAVQVTPLQFTTYIEALQLGADFAGVQGIGLALIVEPKQLAAHEAKIRQERIPNYSVHPSRPSSLKAPIVQVEPPTERNRIALGFDPYSDPVRRAAMERASTTNLPSISGKLTYGIEKAPDALPSFVMYAPVFKPGTLRNTPQTRHADVLGWVFAPIRMSELMVSLYGEHDPDVEISIYDGNAPTNDALLYRSQPSKATQTETDFQAREYLEVAGRYWLIEGHDHPGFRERYGRDDSKIIAISGFFMSTLLAVIAWLMASSRSRAINLAKEMTEELRSSEERWKFALEGAGDGVWDRDLRTDKIFFSRRCREIFGYSEAEFGTQRSDWIKRIHPDDIEHALADTQACIEGRTGNFASEYRLRCKNGGWKWILARGHVTYYDENGKPQRLIGTISDISERKHTEERIRHMAQHDALTGLPNRALFFDRFRQAIALARRDNKRIALLFVDLNRFKPINDEYGHAIGDQVLQQTAQRLSSAIRESDTVGRVGGDEFVILLPNVNTDTDVSQVADKVHNALAEPMIVETLRLNVSASIGFAVFPEHGDDELSLMKAADLAMYRIKQASAPRHRNT